MKIDLSNSEWKLMNRLWQKPPMTITELTAAMKEETGWSKNTIITMLSRLEAKGAVRHEEGRRAKQYFPAVGREDAIEAETETFLDKVGGLGLLKGRKATIYPGMEEFLTGATHGAEKVVTDNNIMTSMGPGTAMDFGLALVERLCGPEAAENLRKDLIFNI